MFRNEKYVKINDIQISRNGFKNLTFETSKFSDRFSSIRGFGSIFNSKNLNTVDIFSVDFVIDYEELREFALVYSMFKAFGVLPLENEYILNKIKGSLAYDKAVAKLSKTDKDTLVKNTKTNVFLERMAIKSLERTNNGYEVSMVLSLYRRGFSDSEFIKFRGLYDEWNNQTKFENMCLRSIDEEILKLKNDGSITLEFMNIDKVNAKIKNGILLEKRNSVFSSTDNKDEKENEESYERNELLKYGSLDEVTKIKIPRKNIGQIEFITHNNISDLPIAGEPIGMKSFMGAGHTTFIAKMIFDEDDAEILSQLKELSDKDVTKSMMTIKTALMQLFDFHSASVSKIFFNNIEEANGVMVTIMFDVNSYRHDNQEINSNLSTVFKGTTPNHQNIKLFSLHLESLVNQILKQEPDPQKIINMYANAVETTVTDNAENKSDVAFKDNSRITTLYFSDILSSYSSSLTAMCNFNQSSNNPSSIIPETGGYQGQKTRGWLIEKIKATLGHEYMSEKNFKMYNNRYNIFSDKELNSGNTQLFNADISAPSFIKNEYELISKDILSNRYFYRIFDGLGILNNFSNINFIKALGKYRNDYLSTFVDKTTNELYNDLSTIDSVLPNMMKRYFYRNLFSNIFDFSLTVRESMGNVILDKDYITSNGVINFKKIKERLSLIYDLSVEKFETSLYSEKMYEKSISFIVERAERNPEQFKNYNIDYQYLEETLINEYDNFKMQFSNEKNSNRLINIDTVYAIFLSKLSYTLCNLNTEYKITDFADGDSLNKFIDALIFSSAHMGLLLVKTDGRTDSFGYAIQASSDNFGGKMSSYLYLLKEAVKETEEITDEDFVLRYFGKFNPISAVEDIKINLSYYKELDNDVINKDYNYFYGKKVENKFPEMLMVKSFENSKNKIASEFIKEFLTKNILDFVKQEKYCDKVYAKYGFMGKTFGKLPYYFEKIFLKKKDSKELINEVMQKRIISHSDPFDNIKKITEMVSEVSSETIPDYDIVIGKENKGLDFGTMFKYVNLKNYIELNNVASIKVYKDPETKIKSAKITIIDFNKRLLDLDTQGQSISFKVASDEHENRIEIFSITPGDEIKISLGYSGKKDNVFCGFITGISNNGGFIEINCSGNASLLYSNLIKEMKLGPKGFWKTIGNSVSAGFKEFSTSEKIVDKKIMNRLVNVNKINSHLFNAFGSRLDSPLSKGDEASMYNAFNSALGFLSRESKNKFSSNSITNGALVVRKDTVQQLFRAFGTLDGVEDPRNTASNIDFYRNIFNVDYDYEVYGITDVTDYIYDVENKYNGENYSYVSENDYSEYSSDERNEIEGNVNSTNVVFSWPCDSRRITSKFSLNRLHPTLNVYKAHPAIDIGPIRDGKNPNYIYATADGVVITSERKGANGLWIQIEHNKTNQVISQYLHLSELYVKPGQAVKQGERIGKMGNTGTTNEGKLISTGVHLDFRIKIKGKNKNPEIILGLDSEALRVKLDSEVVNS